MSPITTHVLDTALGRPAAGVPARLEHLSLDEWRLLGQGITNEDGRIRELLASDARLQPGLYRLTFDTSSYFQMQGIEGFYPYVPIVFELKQPAAHYHVPLLLSPFGYSTYRGS